MGISGRSFPCETPAVRRTVIPGRRPTAANSSHRRLLPTPASPTTPTTCARPSLAAAKASVENRDLSVAPHHRHDPERPDGAAQLRRFGALQHEDPERFAGSLHGRVAEILQSEPPVDQPGGVLRQVGRAGLGAGFHALGQADGVTEGGGIEAQVLTDPGDHHLAGVESETGVQVDTVRGAQFLGIGGDCVDEVPGGVTGPPRVILLGDRRPEERHDPVAGELVHRAAEPTDPLSVDLHEAGHDLGPYLGVHVLLEIHGALHVGEEDGDLLALTLRLRGRGRG